MGCLSIAVQKDRREMMEVNKEIVDKRTQLAIERITQWRSYVEVSVRVPHSLLWQAMLLMAHQRSSGEVGVLVSGLWSVSGRAAAMSSCCNTATTSFCLLQACCEEICCAAVCTSGPPLQPVGSHLVQTEGQLKFLVKCSCAPSLHLQVLHQVISQAGQPVPEIPAGLLKALVPGTKSMAAGQHWCVLWCNTG